MNTPQLSRRNQFGILFSLVLCLFSIEVFFRLKGIPVPGGDSLFFYPASQFYHLHGELYNPIQSPIKSGGGYLNWHGWVHPYLIGLFDFGHSSSYISVTVSETIILGIGCLLFIKVTESVKEASIWTASALVVSVTAVALSFLGRPESVAFVLLVSGVATLQHLNNSPLRFWLITLQWGILGATHPTVALLAGPALLVYLIASTPRSSLAVRRWTTLGAASVTTTFLLTTLIYPHSISDWIQGLWEHSQKISSRGRSGGLIYYYFLMPSRFMQGFWILFGYIFGSLLFLNFEFEDKKTILVPVVLGSILVWYTSIRLPPASYNIFSFLPVISTLLLYYTYYTKSNKISFSVRYFIIFMGIISLLLISRRYLVFYNSINDQPLREDLRERVDKIPDCKSVFLDKGLLISSYSPKKWTDFHYIISKTSGINPDYLVIKQAQSGNNIPEKIDGYKIVDNEYSKKGIYLGPIKAANTPASYNFSIYRLEE